MDTTKTNTNAEANDRIDLNSSIFGSAFAMPSTTDQAQPVADNASV